MNKTFLIVLLYIVVLVNGYAQRKNITSNVSDQQFFIENKGQWHPDVLYLCRMKGLDVWVTKYGLNQVFYKKENIQHFSPYEKTKFPINRFHQQNYRIIGHRVLMKLQNHKPDPAREGKNQLEAYYNYFIGNDPSKHSTYVGLYKEAIVKNIYEGIDIRYYFDKGYLRHDYVVHPYADPTKIAFILEGSDKTYLNDKGNLIFNTRFGEVAMAELKTYQAKDGREVPSKFVCKNGSWYIEVANYDRSQTLIIDPLIYSTYIGGTGDDFGGDIVVDASGNAYITGATSSADYDITAGAFQTTYKGGDDVFITKLNPTGTSLIYSTYIGGDSSEVSLSIVVDNAGNTYVGGYTNSLNYSVTTGVYQTTNQGQLDAFVTKLNNTGTTLLYSTYLGGSQGEFAFRIAVDASGNAYITGGTSSTNYPTTTGVFQSTNQGMADVFVTKLNPTGSGLVYSTFIGGDDWDTAYDIAVDNSGNAYITGLTLSSNYDVTTGVFQNTHAGGADVFVTKLNPTGTGLTYSTYIGGSNYEHSIAIALDAPGNAYITGYAEAGYDVTTGAFQTSYGGGSYDVFVTKINTSGTSLLYSTYIGGDSIEFANTIAVDNSGNAYITGNTKSPNYDVTTGAIQTTKDSLTDAFVTKLNASGTALLYSTYLGGNGYDEGYGIFVDAGGSIYVTGQTDSPNYDVTTGVFQTTNGGGFDVFVTKIDASSTSILPHDLPTLNWSLYPNPNNGTFVIEAQKAGIFELIDITGKILRMYNVQNGQQYPVQENLPAGMYFIRELNTGSIRKFSVE